MLDHHPTATRSTLDYWQTMNWSLTGRGGTCLRRKRVSRYTSALGAHPHGERWDIKLALGLGETSEERLRRLLMGEVARDDSVGLCCDVGLIHGAKQVPAGVPGESDLAFRHLADQQYMGQLDHC